MTLKHLFKSIIGFLNRDLSGHSLYQRAYHPYIGNMLLFAFKNSDQSYWEAEVNFEGYQIGVSIDAPDFKEPSEQQIEFARRIITEPDVAFSQALPLLSIEFERWHKKPLPSDWRAALKFVGFSVPVDGDDKNEWELSYESLWDAGGHLLTCSFIDGEPKTVSVDG